MSYVRSIYVLYPGGGARIWGKESQYQLTRTFPLKTNFYIMIPYELVETNPWEAELNILGAILFNSFMA